MEQKECFAAIPVCNCFTSIPTESAQLYITRMECKEMFLKGKKKKKTAEDHYTVCVHEGEGFTTVHVFL